MYRSVSLVLLLSSCGLGGGGAGQSRERAAKAGLGPTVTEFNITPENPAPGGEATATVVIRDDRGVRGFRVRVGNQVKEFSCDDQKVCRKTLLRVVPERLSGTVTIRLVAENTLGQRTSMEREVTMRPETQPAGSMPPPSSPGELALHEGFETGKIGPGWTGFSVHDKTLRAEESDSVDIVTNPVRKGKYALKLTVRSGDAVFRGDVARDKERCELIRLNACRNGSCSLGNEGREGSEYWYAWSVFIPRDYQYRSTSARNYQIMGQWHDQPDPGRKPTGYSPPIAVHYRSSGTGGGFQVQYGLRQRGGPIQTMDTPIEKGRWVDWMFHIRFSPGADGFLEAWKDGVMLASARGATRITGPNMFNDQPNYLRLGLYRGRSQTQTNILYYDEIGIATSRAALLRE